MIWRRRVVINCNPQRRFSFLFPVRNLLYVCLFCIFLTGQGSSVLQKPEMAIQSSSRTNFVKVIQLCRVNFYVYIHEAGQDNVDCFARENEIASCKGCFENCIFELPVLVANICFREAKYVVQFVM